MEVTSSTQDNALRIVNTLRTNIKQIHREIGFGDVEFVATDDFSWTDTKTGRPVITVTTISGDVKTDFIVTGETDGVIPAGINAAFHTIENAIVTGVLNTPDNGNYCRQRWCIVATNVAKGWVEALNRHKIPVSVLELAPDGTCQFHQCPEDSNATFATKRK